MVSHTPKVKAKANAKVNVEGMLRSCFLLLPFGCTFQGLHVRVVFAVLRPQERQLARYRGNRRRRHVRWKAEERACLSRTCMPS